MAKSMEQLADYARVRASEHHKYKKGGWSWKTGLECHAFVGLVYKECGYTGIYNRIRKKGFWRKATGSAYLGKWLHKKRLSGLKASDLKPGDILYTGSANHHTGIYIGNSMVAEAGGKCTKVKGLNNRRSKFKYCFRITEQGTTKKAKKAQNKVKKKAKKAAQKKSNEQIAREVVAGKWGNGSTRKKKLKAAGYNWRKIQNIVNKMAR